MTSALHDLWPAIETPQVRAPVAILREQAALLGPKTKNLVEAQVTSEGRGEDIVHSFSIVAPALDFYQYPLFAAKHHATRLFPVWVGGISPELCERIAQATELEQRPTHILGTQDRPAIVAHDEAAMRSVLREIFADRGTGDAIGSLLAQSQSS